MKSILYKDEFYYYVISDNKHQIVLPDPRLEELINTEVEYDIVSHLSPAVNPQNPTQKIYVNRAQIK